MKVPDFAARVTITLDLLFTIAEQMNKKQKMFLPEKEADKLDSMFINACQAVQEKRKWVESVMKDSTTSADIRKYSTFVPLLLDKSLEVTNNVYQYWLGKGERVKTQGLNALKEELARI
jgi:hypothetical protein